MHSQTLNPISEILASIRKNLSQAQEWSDDGSKENAAYDVERAFVETKLLLEAVALPKALDALRRIEREARKDYGQTDFSVEVGEKYLVWAASLYHYLAAVESLFGEPKAGTITKDVIQILRETQYSITDHACFPQPPRNERDVHVRIEAVLRCVFPDLIHKPRITKQIKHFEPDTGLPSIRTLIEYKFIATATDAKKISEEVLADTRGYISKEWDRFIYVIYETKRIKPERQWKQLFRSSEIGSNTEIIVIHGEEPSRRKVRAATKTTVRIGS